VSAAPANHWKLGLFVVAGLALGLAVLAFLGVRAGRRDTFPVVTYFDESVQGLEVGAPVKVRGARVGNVSAITIAPDRRHVEVWCDIDRDLVRRLGGDPETATLRPELRTQLSQIGIAGTMFVLVEFVDPQRHPPPPLDFPTPENYVPSMRSTIRGLTDQVQSALEKLPVTLAKIDRAIDDADVAGVSSRAKVLLDRGTVVVNDLEGLGGSLEGNLETLHETLRSFKAVADLLERDPGAVLHGKAEAVRSPRGRP
jgi:ABC-type transporter Mla subunit MlaD